MDGIILTTRFGAHREVVRCGSAALANLQLFSAVLRNAHPELGPSDTIDAFILVPAMAGSVSSALIEVQLTGPTDLAALKTGDLIVVKRSVPATIKVATAEAVAAMSPAPKKPADTAAGTSPDAVTPAAKAAPRSQNAAKVSQVVPEPPASPGPAPTPVTPIAGKSSLSSLVAATPTGHAATLSRLHLTVDDDGRVMAVDASVQSAAKASPVKSGKKGRGTDVGTVQGRVRLGLRDILPPPQGTGRLPPGPDALSAAEAAICASQQASLVTKFGLQSVRLPLNAPADAPSVKVLASPGWREASSLVLIVPGTDMPAGMWSATVSLLVGVNAGSVGPYLSSLDIGKDVGVVLLNPYANHAGGSPIPGHDSPMAHMQAVWDTMLGEPSQPVACIAHGGGCDILLALLSEPARGMAARARVRGLAFLAPPTPPKAVLAASVGATVSRATAGVLRTLLRSRCVCWSLEQRPPVVAPPVDRVGNVPVDPQLLGADPASFSEDAGCWTQTCGVYLPGTAAYREESAPLYEGYVAMAARVHVLAFLKHMLAAPTASAASWLAADSAKAGAGSIDTATAPASAATPTKTLDLASVAKAVSMQVQEQEGAAVTPAPVPAPLTRGKSRAALLMQAAGDMSPSGNAPLAVPSPLPPVAPDVDNGTGTGLVLTPSKGKEGGGVAASLFILPPTLPDQYAPVARAAAARLSALHLDAFKPGGGSEWKANGMAGGVKMYTPAATASTPPDAPAGEAFVGGRGDSILPFSVAEVLEYLIDPKSRFALDPQLDSATVVEQPSVQTQVIHMKFKGVFPTDPRDFATIGGWEANEEGGAIIFGTSLTHEKIPKAKGFVRGWLDIGGWVLSPLSKAEYGRAAQSLGLPPPGPKDGLTGACRVSYIFRTAIGGTVPAFVVQQVTGAQAKLPATLSKLLTARRSKLGPAATRVGPAVNMGSVVEDPITSQAPVETSGDGVGAVASEVKGVDEGADAYAAPVPAPSAHGAHLDLSGVWKLDKAASDTLDELLTEMGVPWVARKMAASLEVTTSILHDAGASRLAITEASSLGEATSTQVLDWVERSIPGADGAGATQQRAIALAGTDSVPGMTGLDKKGEKIDAAMVEAAINAYVRTSSGTPGPYPLYGTTSGVVVTYSVPPKGMGAFLDGRSLDTPSRLRLVTLYIKDGIVKCKLTRFYSRVGRVPAGIAAAAKNKRYAPGVEHKVASAPAPTPVPADVPTPAPVSPAVKSAIPPTVPASPAQAATPAPTSTSKALVVASPVAVVAVSHAAVPATTPVVSASPAPLSALSPAQVATPAALLTPTPASIGAVIIARKPLPSRPAQMGTTQAAPSGFSYAAWQPDEAVSACVQCKASFGGVTRKHHCRICGLVVCDACSQARFPPLHFHAAALKAGKMTREANVRMCNPCAAPVLLSLTGAGTGGGPVTASGGNLGSEELLKAGKVRVDVSRVLPDGSVGPAQAIPRASMRVQKPFSALSFTMPPGIGTWVVRVEVDGKCGPASTLHWAYDAPVVSSVSAVDTDGGLALVTGDNLGTAGDEGLSFSSRLSGCALGSWVEPHKRVMVRIPAKPAVASGAGIAPVPVLLLAAVDGEPCCSHPVAYQPPHVFSVTNDAPGSGRLIVYGASLGADASSITVMFKSPVTQAEHQCTHVAVDIPHVKLSAALPKGVALTAWCAVTVSVGGLEASLVVQGQ